MDDLRDEMDKYEKDKKDKSYLMIEEVIDPIEDRKQFTILRPSYRDLTPNENPVIKKIQETLENRIKRGILPGLSPETKEWVKKWKERFQNNENSQKEDFPAPKPLEIGSEDGSILKKVADAIEDSDSASKTDQKPKMSEVFEVGSESGEKPVDLPQDDNGMRKGKLDGTKSMSQMIADRLGLPEDKGPIMIEPEGQILPLTLDYFTYEDAEIPSKVVVETKKKMTIIYDDGAEESNSKQSSEEHETNQLLKPSKEASEANILGNSQVQAAKTVKMESHDRLPVPADNPAVDPISSGKSDFAEATKQFSKNFVLTLSVSPLMFSIMAGFCLLILIIKAYFLYFPRHKRATLPPQKSEPPISVITVQKPLP
uniref:Uncharacterized protein n=1 Tax=Panagrolaimus sp. JU765 TaxID=591449 RepID=A0AC34R7N2_9BILA